MNPDLSLTVPAQNQGRSTQQPGSAKAGQGVFQLTRPNGMGEKDKGSDLFFRLMQAGDADAGGTDRRHGFGQGKPMLGKLQADIPGGAEIGRRPDRTWPEWWPTVAGGRALTCPGDFNQVGDNGIGRCRFAGTLGLKQ